MRKFIINNPPLSFLLSSVIGIVAGAFSSYYNLILGPLVWFLTTLLLSGCVFHVLEKSIDDTESPRKNPTEDNLKVTK